MKQLLIQKYMKNKVSDKEFHAKMCELDVLHELEDRANGACTPTQMMELSESDDEFNMWLKISLSRPHADQRLNN